MWSLGRSERKLARLKDFDLDDLHDQIDTLRAYVNELTGAPAEARAANWAEPAITPPAPRTRPRTS